MDINKKLMFSGHEWVVVDSNPCWGDYFGHKQYPAIVESSFLCEKLCFNLKLTVLIQIVTISQLYKESLYEIRSNI